MMLGAALILLAAGVPASDAPPANEPEEIQVIARRLASIGVSVTRDPQGRYQCDLGQSTGLVKLDAALCKATTKCVRKTDASAPAVKQCIERSKPGLIARIGDYLRERQPAGGGA